MFQMIILVLLVMEVLFLNKMTSPDYESENLEDTVEEEICLGHLIKDYRIVCKMCEKSDYNKYCPYYGPVIR